MEVPRQRNVLHMRHETRVTPPRRLLTSPHETEDWYFNGKFITRKHEFRVALLLRSRDSSACECVFVYDEDPHKPPKPQPYKDAHFSSISRLPALLLHRCYSSVQHSTQNDVYFFVGLFKWYCPAPYPSHSVAKTKELHVPVGWVRVPLTAPVARGGAAAAADAAVGGEGPALRAHFVQICVVAMHQNGRDTHIRQVGAVCFWVRFGSTSNSVLCVAHRFNSVRIGFASLRYA